LGKRKENNPHARKTKTLQSTFLEFHGKKAVKDNTADKGHKERGVKKRQFFSKFEPQKTGNRGENSETRLKQGQESFPFGGGSKGDSNPCPQGVVTHRMVKKHQQKDQRGKINWGGGKKTAQGRPKRGGNWKIIDAAGKQDILHPGGGQKKGNHHPGKVYWPLSISSRGKKQRVAEVEHPDRKNDNTKNSGGGGDSGKKSLRKHLFLAVSGFNPRNRYTKVKE